MNITWLLWAWACIQMVSHLTSAPYDVLLYKNHYWNFLVSAFQ